MSTFDLEADIKDPLDFGMEVHDMRPVPTDFFKPTGVRAEDGQDEEASDRNSREQTVPYVAHLALDNSDN